ncbi:hypothetical protein MFLAVUS_009469 [Mucor flavus]|uniref:Uncharacterized protein n=1 Tax=Mucor flavus TaxID=439312 RepID=A0ABP9Z9Z1_9FUNG
MQLQKEEGFNLVSDNTEEDLDENELVSNTIDPCLEADILLTVDNLKTDFDEDIVIFQDLEEFLTELYLLSRYSAGLETVFYECDIHFL